ncbi:hypothetical protein [Streptomyces cavernae]|uniref:hypothetical protein n=1 Tax=Streptomyces cavernae TaxID=2259034 RepID=UPI0012D94A27|nr:hypothetical protein [Streptomyces cavernae]
MRLYTRTGATAVDDPEYGNFQADDEGGFDLPDPLANRLHGFHINGRPAWETDLERQNRLIAEEIERRKDPATLLAAVQQLVAAAQSLPQAAAEPPATPAKRTPKRATAPSK